MKKEKICRKCGKGTNCHYCGKVFSVDYRGYARTFSLRNNGPTHYICTVCAE